jgi:hypothetical protein
LSNRRPVLRRRSLTQSAFLDGGRHCDPGNQTEAVGDADPVAATALGMKNLARVSDMLLAATTTQAGVLARVRTAQTSVPNSLLQPARRERMTEQVAIDGAYAPVQLLADVRRGIWSELATPGRTIDAYRRNTQRAWLDTMDNRLNSGRVTTSETKALVKGELRTLEAQVRAAIPATSDRPRRRQPACRPAAPDPAPYDFDNDPFPRLPDGCWVDPSLR